MSAEFSFVEHEAGCRRTGTLDEQPHRLVFVQFTGRESLIGIGMSSDGTRNFR